MIAEYCRKWKFRRFNEMVIELNESPYRRGFGVFFSGDPSPLDECLW
jgi:hypothetical protein